MPGNMSGNLERTTRAYIGHNKAHRQFVQKITNEKIFVCSIMKNMGNLISTFQKDVDAVRRTGHKEFALAVVTKVVSPTQFKAINVRENESALIAENSQAFQSQVYGKAFAEVHRIFVDYTVDLLDEILNRTPNPKKYDDMSRKKIRDKAYDDVGICILPGKDTGGITADEIRDRLNDLENTRHVIEHNNGIVDERYLQRNPKTRHKLGERIVIGPEQIGEAIALVETLAEDLNERVLGKFFPHLSH